MKKYLSLLMVALFATLSASKICAQTFTIDGITYEVIDNNSKEVAVSQISSAVRNCVLPQKVTYENATYKVTQIHSLGYQSYNLTSLTIPKSVAIVDGYAFRDCTKLNNIVFEDADEPIILHVRPFSQCPLKQAYIGRDINISYYISDYNDAIFPQKYLEFVSFGENVNNIAAGMFTGCKKLQSIELPDSVLTIGDYAFANCTGLTEFRMPQSLKTIGQNAFEGCIGITEIELPNSVETIGSCVFQNCSNLSSIILSSSLTSIPYNAFASVPIESLSIPNSVIEISYCAFHLCDNLKVVNIEDGEKTLYFKGSTRAFYDCHLESIYVGRNITYDEPPFYYQPSLQSCVIGNFVTIIPYHFLYECNSIKHITLPNSITSIGGGAFHGCTSLQSIDMPDELLSIGSGAFANCTSLKVISIPGKVNEIENTFSGCDSLKDLRIEDGYTTLTLQKGCFLTTPLESIYLGRNINSVGMSIYGSYSTFNSEATLKTITFGDNVSAIPISAFEGCAELHSIRLPNSLKILAENSFKDCTQLSEVNFGDSIELIKSCAFENCALTKIDLPTILKEIEYYAFKNNRNLKSVVLGDSLKYIGQGAFWGCAIKSINLPGKLQTIGNEAFKFSKLSEILLPNGLETIGIAAFYQCPLRADEFFIPKSVKVIGSDTFNNAKFNNLIIEDSEEYLSFTGDKDYGSAFNGCQLDSLYIGRNISFNTDKWAQTIYGFTNSNVKSVLFGDKVTGISYELFKNCNSLTHIDIPDNIRSIGTSAFENCSQLTNVNMGNGITKIGNFAFRNCLKLNSITCSNQLQEIGKLAFAKTPLQSVELNENLLKIGQEAFNGCFLEKIILPSSITTIEDGAFANNGKIETITCKSLIPPTAAINAFDDIVKIGTPLYVPDTSVSQYKKANCWRDFYSILSGESGISEIESTINDECDIYDLNGVHIYHGLLIDTILSKGLYIIQYKNSTNKMLVK